MNTVRAVGTVAKLALGLLLLTGLSPAFASGGWGYDGVTRPYDTQEAAAAAMQASHPARVPLTKPGTPEMQPDGSVYIKYTAPPRDVKQSSLVWNYLFFSETTGYLDLPTEGEWVAIRIAVLKEFASSVCNSVSMTPAGTWVPQYPPAPPQGANSETKAYTVHMQSYGEYPTPHCSDFSFGDHITRQRSVVCDTYFTMQSSAPLCRNSAYAYVFGPGVESCSNKTPPPFVGNPCDVRSGDKTQTETDYSSGLLHFARYYHSATQSNYSGLGLGWTHSYAARLIISGGQPSSLMRPNGQMEAMRSLGGHFISHAGSGIRVIASGSTWVAYLKDGSREIYDAAGLLTQTIDPSGAIVSLSYGSDDLESVTDQFGHSLVFSYTDGVITSVTPSGTSPITFQYDSGDNLTEVHYPGGTSKTYHYENSSLPNHLTGITDEANVRFATWTYNANGRAISSEHAGGVEHYDIEYTSSGTAVVTEPLGAETTYAFTTTSNAPRLTSLSRNGLTSTYAVPSTSVDQQRRVSEMEDAAGNITKFTYDTYHETSRTEGFGTTAARTTGFTYASAWADKPDTVTEADRTTGYTYNSLGNVLTRTVTDTSVTPNVSRVWTYTYDTYGRMLTADGPRTDVTDVTEYTHYTCTTGAECGQLHTVENALGQVTTYDTYNDHGQPLTIIDANGVTTTLTYDSRLRLTSRQVGSETTSFTYWPTGLLKRVTLPDGSYTQNTYDDAHRLTEVVDGSGNKIVFTLDAMGNRTSEDTFDLSNTLRRTHGRVYNALNQLFKDISAAGSPSVTTQFGYDDNGNQTDIDAPLSRSTDTLYDELNRLVKITDPAAGETQFDYDSHDNLTEVVDPRGLVTTYVRNGFGDVKQQVSPDTGTTNNTYDSGGNLKTSTDSRGVVTTYEYDELDRVSSAAFALSSTTDQTISYVYDTGTNGKGHLTGASDSGHSMGWSFDAVGRVTSKAQTVGSLSKTVGYTYTNGRLTTLTLPSGQAVTYGYNINGEVSSVAVGSTNVLHEVTYEPFGPVKRWVWDNCSLTVREYDQDGLIAAIDSAGRKIYGYDDALRITGITDTVKATNSWDYEYDELDRLTDAVSSARTHGWTYDANGNRLSETGTTASTFSVSSISNRLNSATGHIARTYTYDAVGNALAWDTLTATYNNRGRLKTLVNSATSASATYVYNALGQLAKQSGGASGTRYYAYDEAGHLLGEYDGSGNLVQETVWLGDIPVATLRPNGGGVDIYYVHTDHLNTPRVVTRPSDNAVVWRWDSDAFGTESANENPSSLGTFVYNLRFPGQAFDGTAGLHQNMFRDYSPATGRYVQSDPIGLHGGINTYGYVDQSPLAFADPYGLAGCESNDRDCLQEALNSYSLERSFNEIAGFGIGSAIFGGSVQVLNKSAIKPRGGIAGGGPSREYTSYSRRYLGEIGKRIGRVSVGAAAKAVGIVGAGVQAYRLHLEALQIYLECLQEKKQ